MILRILLTLCLNNDNQVIHFLVEEQGIDIMKHLFEKVGKNGKLSLHFVEMLFEILKLPMLQNSTNSSKTISAIIEKIVFNIKIWSNSEYDVQIYLIDCIQELFQSDIKIPFSPSEPYRGILRMLYDYFAPEETEDVEMKKFLRRIKSKLTHILVIYLREHGTRTMTTFFEFLLPSIDEIYSIRDLLYVIMLYQSPDQKKGNSNLFSNYIRDSYLKKRKEYDLIVALHTLINNAIVRKASTIQLASIEAPNTTKNTFDCCERIIAYCLHILLSINWVDIFEGRETPNLVASKILTASDKVLQPINNILGNSEWLLSYLCIPKSKAKITSSEDVILRYVFHRLNNLGALKETYEKHYLGERSYTVLLSHMLADPSVFYKKDKEIQQIILNMKEQDFNLSRFKLIYTRIIENIRAFEPLVQQTIMKDAKRFFENKAFSAFFLNSDAIFEAVSGYLAKEKYLANPEIKSSLESIYLLFANNYWSDKSKREYNRIIFKEIVCFSIPEYLLLCNELLTKLLSNSLISPSDENIYTAIQFVYTIEDSTIRIPKIISQPLFIEIIGKLIVYLNELHILYYIYPSFVPYHLSRELNYENEVFYQREGGMPRAILKILFSMVLHSGEIDEQIFKLVLKLLNFFVFRKSKTLKTILQILKISLQEEKNASKGKFDPGNGTFLEFPIKGTIIQNKYELIFHDKAVASQKSVDDLRKSLGGRTEIFESSHFRALYLITQLAQVLIYMAFKTNSYNDIHIDEERKEPLQEESYGIKYLAKLFGKVLRARSTIAAGISKMVEEVTKEMVTIPKYSISKYFSNFEGYTKEIIDKLRPLSDFQPEKPVRAGLNKGKLNIPSLEEEKISLQQKFQVESTKIFIDLCETFTQYSAKKFTIKEYTSKIIIALTSKTYLETVQRWMHHLTTEDFLVVEKMIILLNEGRPKVTRRKAHPRIQPKE